MHRRTRAIALGAALVLTSCVQDFVATPGGGGSNPPPPPPPPPPSAVALAFASQPADAVAGSVIGSDIRVLVLDDAGDTVTSATPTISLQLIGGKPGAHLMGVTSVNASGGVAVFSGLSIDSAGGGYTLRATSIGLENATSSTFAIRAGAPDHMVFVVQPSNVIARERITPGPAVGFADEMGNVTDVPKTRVSVELRPESGPFGPQLFGDESEDTRDGVATFGDLRVTRTGTNFTLRASAQGFASVESHTFSVLEPNDVIGLAIRQQPTNANAGDVITPAVRVATVNSLGNTVTSGNAQVTLSIMTGSGTAGASLGGTRTVQAVNGEATFSNLRIDSVGAGYQLVATAPNLTPDTSSAFSITAGATARLSFVTQPSGAVAGQALNPAPRVAILDAAGNLVTGATTVVALYITAGTGSPGAVLGGNTTVAASGGIATFSNVNVSAAGSGYTLTAAASGLASDVSSSFSISPAGPPPVASVVVTPGSVTFTAVNATQTLSAEARDAGNQPISGASFSWSSTNNAVATVDGSGKVTAKGNGTATITATSGGQSGTASVTVNQATASVVILPSSPDTLASLGATGTFTAQARDANNQPIAGKAIAWVSEGTAVATIDGTSGVATAVTNGTATIRASVDGFTTTAPLVVWQAIAAVKVTPDSIDLTISQSAQVAADATDARGNPIARPITWTWQSPDAEVTVTADATDASKATITRVAGNKHVDVTVTAEDMSAKVKVH